jgi:hypothetical protein
MIPRSNDRNTAFDPVEALFKITTDAATLVRKLLYWLDLDPICHAHQRHSRYDLYSGIMSNSFRVRQNLLGLVRPNANLCHKRQTPVTV